MTNKIAFIGLGNMGGPMAKNLLKAGHKLKVFDLNPAALKDLESAGALAAADVDAVIADVDVIISMLPSSPHVKSLYLEKSKLIEKIPEGSLVIDCSTIAPEAARDVAEAAQGKKIQMVDAPVSGGVAAATAGTLTFIVGGSKEEYARALPYLEKMGKNFFHAGEHGAGQVAKICNNMCLAIHMIGSAEALALGTAQGLDPKILSDIMVKSSGRNWSLELYNPYPGVMENAPASRDYSGGFASKLMMKDLGLAAEAATAAAASTPLGSEALALYRMHCQHGHENLDFSSILKLIAPLASAKTE